MAVTLTGAGGLFTRLGKAFHSIATLNTARLTTVPTEVNEYIAELDAASAALRATVRSVPAARDGWQSGGGSLATSVAQSAAALIVQMVEDDNPQEEKTLEAALVELIAQMVTASASVDASTPGVTVAMGASNAGNGTCIASTKRGDGKVQENILAESIEGIAGSAASFNFRGETAVTDRLSYLWPDGSGSARSVTVAGIGGLLSNGGFETADTNQTTKPDKWDVAVGTLGTTLKMTAVEVQTVAISGTPTGGSYTLSWVNAASKSQTTVPLVWNATSAAVQAALRQLKGLELVTVVESGTTPNLTHTITFTGVTNPAQLTATSALTGGTPVITPGTTTAGSANVYTGARSLEFDSDAAQLTEIRQKLTTLKAGTVYAVNLLALADVVPAAGVFTVDLYDGSAIINDQAGVANSFTFTGAGLTTSFVAKNGYFRTPTILPPIVYLRIRISTAVSAGTSVFIDHVSFVAATELYAGGPYLTIFAGSTPHQADDTISLAVTNDRAGLFQEWFERAFGMRGKDLLLPSNDAGAETIVDTLIA